MILGVGTDLIEISRMERACKKDYFVMRTFTDMESRQAKGSASKLAGSFAVKEAVAKALGTGFRSFMPIDVEVLRDELGRPYVRLYGGAQERFHEIGMERLLVSITNTRDYAMAFAVGEGRSGGERSAEGGTGEGRSGEGGTGEGRSKEEEYENAGNRKTDEGN